EPVTRLDELVLSLLVRLKGLRQSVRCHARSMPAGSSRLVAHSETFPPRCRFRKRRRKARSAPLSCMTGNRTPGPVRETIMRTRMGIIAALLLTVGLVGCGGNDGGDGVASANGSTGSPTNSASSGSGSERDKALRYAQCMRENGVPKFP